MSTRDEIKKVRIEKLQKLLDAGMEPYPPKVPRDMSLAIMRERFNELEKTQTKLSLAGRITAIRGQGAILFVVLKDCNTTFQAVFKKDDIASEKLFELFQDTADMGDFISVTGQPFMTKRGEQSLLVATWTMASKALLPLPEKWHGLADAEEKRRRRYLDIISDEGVYERFALRSQIIAGIREYLGDLNFLEIETPILQTQAGGAMARTFGTYHNDYDMDMVLRIALELEHKIVMAAGYPRIFEIGKVFRNEGSDPTHIQEFTMLEWYAAYATLEDNMMWTEAMIKKLAEDIAGTTSFTVLDKKGEEIKVNISDDWPRVRFGDLLAEHAEIDVVTSSDGEVREKAVSLGMLKEDAEKTSRANLLDFIYKKTARGILINPTFVVDYPGDLKPLAQQNDDGTAKVAQLVIGGAEITNQYAELVDPVGQRELLETQTMAKQAGDTEAMDIDERFLEAMEHGMPPMTGFGLGIDRLVALFTEQKNLRDVIFFPIMKPPEKAKQDKNN
jgi:lysyl-tRNA synthetase class 2